MARQNEEPSIGFQCPQRSQRHDRDFKLAAMTMPSFPIDCLVIDPVPLFFSTACHNLFWQVRGYEIVSERYLSEIIYRPSNRPTTMYLWILNELHLYHKFPDSWCCIFDIAPDS
jgi:hypothetical protein